MGQSLGQSLSLGSASQAAPAGGGFGFGSLGTSLAIHGALMASLVLAVDSARTPSESGGVTLNIQAQLEDASSAEWRAEAPEQVQELTPEILDEELPLELDEFGMLPAQPTDSVFDEPFDANDPVLPAWDLVDLLEDPELTKPTPPPATESNTGEPEIPEAPAVSPEPAAEADVPAEEAPDEGAGAIVSPTALPADCPTPTYPRVAVRRGWTGTVVLLIRVAADGSVEDVEVESTSGHNVLDEAALKAVRTWKFRAGTLGGNPAALTVRKPIKFGA